MLHHRVSALNPLVSVQNQDMKYEWLQNCSWLNPYTSYYFKLILIENGLYGKRANEMESYFLR